MDEYLHPKISGFRFSKILDFVSVSINQQSTKGLKGTPLFMAPEVLECEEYSKASDVYSFGLIVYEIFMGERPFPNMNFYQFY